jgi:hypothetical protein
MLFILDGDIGDRLCKGFGFGAGHFLGERNPLRPSRAVHRELCSDAPDQRKIITSCLGAVVIRIDPSNGMIDGAEQIIIQITFCWRRKMSQ